MKPRGSLSSLGVRCAWVILVAALAGACTTSGPDSSSGSSVTTTTSAPPVTTTSTTTLPTPWAPASGAEPAPEVKIAATRALQVLATYDTGAGTLDAARERLRAAGLEPGLADGAAGILDASAPGMVEIVYPQLGGLEPNEASVMVIARFVGASTVTRTVDVRLALGPTGWRAAAIASVGGEPPAPPDPSLAALALLHEPRVDLPDSARWDLERGFVDDRVVELVRSLAVDHRLHVTVFGSGHPTNVFGTDRVSNHTAGRGVDIWSIDGRPVAELREEPVIVEIIERARAEGATEIGAPIDTDGPGGIVFTNTVHHDHLHLAFRR